MIRKKYLIAVLAALTALFSGCAVMPPMHTAAARGDVKAMQTLLDKGANVDENYYGTPLISAAGAGKLDAVKFLLDKGANVNAQGMFGMTALSSAAAEGKTDVAQYLISRGASAELAQTALDNWMQACVKMGANCVAKVQTGTNVIRSAYQSSMQDQAKAAYDRGDYVTAEKLLTELIAFKPLGDYYAYLADVYLNENKLPEAESAIKMSIANGPIPYTYTVQARLLEKQGKLKEAEQALLAAIAANPGQYNSYIYAAHFYHVHDEYQKAGAMYDKAAAININNPWITYDLGVLSINVGDYAKAVEYLEKSMSYLVVSGVGLEIGQSGNGISVVRISLPDPADSPFKPGDILLSAGGVSLKGKDVDAAVAALRGEAGTSVNVTVLRGGQTTDITAVRRLIYGSQASDTSDMLYLAYRQLGKKDMAEKIRAILDENFKDSDNRAEADALYYYDAGRYDDVIKTLMPSAKRNHFSGLVLAMAYASLKNADGAADSIATIPDAYFSGKSDLRGKVVAQMYGLLAPMAQEHAKKGDQLAQINSFRDALKEYTLAAAISDAKQGDVYLEKIAAVIKNNPSLIETDGTGRDHALRAEMQTKAGNFDKAVDEYRQAIRYDSYSPILYKAMALNCAELKRYADAAVYIKKYLILSPDGPDARSARDSSVKWEYMAENGL